MGTTLTGLTPATTYDALIKVGDNGPLSATAKYVGDGLGNDSVVALSTSSVGIGTTSPTQLLHVAGNVRITGALYDGNNAAGTSGQILSSTGTGTDWVSKSDLGLVDGSGTANYVSKWSDTDTLTNSVIYDNGSAVGIGTTSNSYTSAGRGNLNIAGSAGAILGFQIGGAAKGYVFHDNTNLQLWNEVAGDLLFGANATERMRITSAGNVGIGTSSPTEKLHIVGSSDVTVRLQRTGVRELNLSSAGITATSEFLNLTSDYGALSAITFIANSAERMRITSAGNVGIQTSTASRVLTLKNNTGSTNGISFQSSVTTSEIAAIECNQSLDTIDFEMVSNYAGNGFRFLTGTPTLVERARFTANGLTFNGDTAAANALDDYEEGSWTVGVSFGGGTTGITYTLQNALYTKIGRQVNVSCIMILSNKGTSTGIAKITGLPFTANTSDGAYSAASLRFTSITFGGQFQGYVEPNTTTIVLNNISEAGLNDGLYDTNFANNSTVIINATYFV